jgi:formate dehydrogenase iron-sulfur subunit
LKMRTTVYVPRDAAALSNGAEAVAAAIAAEAQRRDAPVRIIRNGSRGLNWLEPLVEVATASANTRCLLASLKRFRI